VRKKTRISQCNFFDKKSLPHAKVTRVARSDLTLKRSDVRPFQNGTPNAVVAANSSGRHGSENNGLVSSVDTLGQEDVRKESFGLEKL